MERRDMEQNIRAQNRLAKFLTVGLLSGIIAAGVNICYMLFYQEYADYRMDKYINILSVSIASIVPGVFAGFLLFTSLKSSVRKGINIFLSIVIIASLISLIAPLGNILVDNAESSREFIALSLPMHIFAPLIYATMLVRSIKR